MKTTDTPRQSGSVHAGFSPVNQVSVVPELEYSSWRYSFSDGRGATRKLGGFTLVHLKLMVRLKPGFVVSRGVENLFDKNDTLQEGYPEAGRTWFANVIPVEGTTAGQATRNGSAPTGQPGEIGSLYAAPRFL